MDAFLRYFIKFVIHSKTKQPLLFLAVFGLVISSFALLFLQSTMGGLQTNLINRSKKVNGEGVITFKYHKAESLNSLYDYLDKESIEYSSELVLELLIKFHEHYSPIIAHGIEIGKDKSHFISRFNELDINDIAMGGDLAIKMGVNRGQQVRLISPAHIDPFMGNIPRAASFYVSDVISTEVPEVDAVESWVPILRLQALVGEKVHNRITLFSAYDKNKLQDFLSTNYGDELKHRTWEQINSTLVWALNLETTVMIFLFSVMSLLVSLSITSGLMLFFNKIKKDLVSFWILGKDEEGIYFALQKFLFLLITVSVLTGLILGTLFLLVLDNIGPQIISDVFVDQKIPIHFNLNMFLISLFIPLSISFFFSWFTLRVFKKEIRYLDHVGIV